MIAYVPTVIRLQVWWHRKANRDHHSLLYSDRRVITCTGCGKRWEL